MALGTQNCPNFLTGIKIVLKIHENNNYTDGIYFMCSVNLPTPVFRYAMNILCFTIYARLYRRNLCVQLVPKLYYQSPVAPLYLKVLLAPWHKICDLPVTIIALASIFEQLVTCQCVYIR